MKTCSLRCQMVIVLRFSHNRGAPVPSSSSSLLLAPHASSEQQPPGPQWQREAAALLVVWITEARVADMTL